MKLPWLTSTWQDLIKRPNGLPHALLITGLKGVGKHQFGLQLAQWLLCKNARAEQLDEACGQCQSCKLWLAGNHPDYRLYEPTEGSRQIKVDDIRQINEYLSKTPQIGRCQVVAIRPVEVMNINAANALLKTLEEPSGESYLLLETERFGSVLPTIRSRCQRISIATPELAQAKAWLAEQGHTDADLALQMHQGAPLAALHWLTNDDNQQQQWMQQLASWSANEIDLLKLSSSWSSLELPLLLQWFYMVLLDVMKSTMGVPENLLTFRDETKALYQSATLDLIKLITLQKKVQQILGQQLSGYGNPNKQLLIESLLIDWQDAIKRDC